MQASNSLITGSERILGTLYADTIKGLSNYNASQTFDTGVVVTTDTVDVAFSKLQQQINGLIKIVGGESADSDNKINQLKEVYSFLENVTEGNILNKFVTLDTAQTISGNKIFATGVFGSTTVQRNDDGNFAAITFRGKSNVYGYIGFNKKDSQLVRIAASNTGNQYSILDASSTYIKDGVIVINGTSITPLTSHQSLANYVTLNGDQTISGKKTFSSQIVSTVKTNTSPFAVASTTVVNNLNADMLDGYHAFGKDRSALCIRGSVYITANLTQSWVKLATINNVDANNECYILLQISGPHTARECTLHISVRYATLRYFKISNNINWDKDKFRLYHSSGSNTYELWGLSNGEYDGINMNVLLYSAEGYMYPKWLSLENGNVTSNQTLPTIDYKEPDYPTYSHNITGSAATLTTGRTLTIGNTGKTFNGSANVSWSLSEIGALGVNANAVSATKLQTARSLWGQSFNGSANVKGSLSSVGNIVPETDSAYNIGSNSLSYNYGYFNWIGSKASKDLDFGANNKSNHIHITVDGNVGIGTGSPVDKLHVNGIFRITRASSANYTLTTNNTTKTFSYTKYLRVYPETVAQSGTTALDSVTSLTTRTSFITDADRFYFNKGIQGSIDVATRATYADRLRPYNNTSRPASADVQYNDGGLRTFLASSSMKTSKPMGDGNIIHMSWDSSEGWEKQIYVGNGVNTHIQIRSQNAKVWSKWITIVDETNEYTTNVTTIILDGTNKAKITPSTTWQDTGITGADLPASGTYIIQMYSHDTGDSQYKMYYSGVMSWFIDNTNDTDTDEIQLHATGHAYNKRLYLRTIQTSDKGGGLKLQIAADQAFSGTETLTFKFKRII